MMALQPLTQIERPHKRRREGSTWLLLDPLLSLHAHPHRRHSECPERLTRIREGLEGSGLATRCHVIACDAEATDDALALVHSVHYLRRLSSLHNATAERLDMTAAEYADVFLNEHSVTCARLAAGGVHRMAEALWAGTMHNGFAIVRPAGHHAGKFGAKGFCLLNSLAVAARQLLERGCERVLIVDWDIHHGDGTQQAFLDEPRVLTFSVHRRGRNVFPFNGAAASPEIVGTGRGAGFNVNVAFDEPRMGDADYAHVWDILLLPMAVLVSAGFDAAKGDPLGDGEVSAAGFARMTRALHAEMSGRLLLVLEGGYSLQQIPACTVACVRALLGDPPTTEELDADAAGVHATPAARDAVEATLAAHAAHWPRLHSADALLPSRLMPMLASVPTPMPAPTPAPVPMPAPPPPPRPTPVPESTLMPMAAEPQLRITHEDIERLPNFTHVLPAEYRSGYLAWRQGKARGAKGEPVPDLHLMR